MIAWLTCDKAPKTGMNLRGQTYNVRPGFLSGYPPQGKIFKISACVQNYGYVCALLVAWQGAGDG